MSIIESHLFSQYLSYGMDGKIFGAKNMAVLYGIASIASFRIRNENVKKRIPS